MPKTLIVAQAPEMQAYIRFLSGRNGWSSCAAPSLQEALAPQSELPDLLIVDGDFGPQALATFRTGCATRFPGAKVLFLAGKPPEVEPLMQWGDRVLPKPFAAGQFDDCLGSAASPVSWMCNSVPTGGLSRWLRRKLDYYSPAQAVLMGAVLLLLLHNVGRSAQAGFTQETGLQAIFWGSILLLCSLFGHVRDKHMRWEGLLFAKFAVLVSLLPPLHTLPDQFRQGLDVLAS